MQLKHIVFGTFEVHCGGDQCPTIYGPDCKVSRTYSFFFFLIETGYEVPILIFVLRLQKFNSVTRLANLMLIKVIKTWLCLGPFRVSYSARPFA